MHDRSVRCHPRTGAEVAKIATASQGKVCSMCILESRSLRREPARSKTCAVFNRQWSAVRHWVRTDLVSRKRRSR